MGQAILVFFASVSPVVGMGEVLTLANDSKASEVVILLDGSFSGNLGNPAAIGNSKAVLREGISILTVGRGDRPSVETGGAGLFTSLVVDARDGGAADLLRAVSAPSIYAYVEAALGGWDQRPLFKSHVSQVLALRCCAPPVDRGLLRQTTHALSASCRGSPAWPVLRMYFADRKLTTVNYPRAGRWGPEPGVHRSPR